MRNGWKTKNDGGRKMTSFSFPEIFRFHVSFLRSKETAPMVLSISMDRRREIRLKKETGPRKLVCFFSSQTGAKKMDGGPLKTTN